MKTNKTPGGSSLTGCFGLLALLWIIVLAIIISAEGCVSKKTLNYMSTGILNEALMISIVIVILFLFSED
jgi:hypothetical protein